MIAKGSRHTAVHRLARSLMPLLSDAWLKTHPTAVATLLVIEVGDASLAYDRDTKRKLDQQAEIALGGRSPRPPGGLPGRKRVNGTSGYLLDSHTLLWWWFEPERLSSSVASLFKDCATPVHVSAACPSWQAP